MTPSRTVLLIALLVFVASCGDGVHSGNVPNQPLVELRTRFSLDANTHPEENARFALIWEKFTPEMVTCLVDVEKNDKASDREKTGIVLECLRQLAESSSASWVSEGVPIEKNLVEHDIPIFGLPSDEKLHKHDGGMLGYGLLVAYEDGNRNGALDLVKPDATESDDSIIAASLNSRLRQVSFVVYREGELSPLWSFFRYYYHCEQEPTDGFSLVKVAVSFLSDPTCSVTSVGQDSIELVIPEDPDRLGELICEPQPVGSTFPETEPNHEVDCNFFYTLRYDRQPQKYCPSWQVYELVGEHWDWRDSPPDWWECTREQSNGFVLTDAEAPITDNRDSLFSLRNDTEQAILLEDIRVDILFTAPPVIDYSSLGLSCRLGGECLKLSGAGEGDRDFSPGEELLLAEPEDFQLIKAKNIGSEFMVIMMRVHEEDGYRWGEPLTELIWTVQ